MASNDQNFGGGAGGGPDTQDHSQPIDGKFRIAANQVEILSRLPLPPAVPDPCVITLLATNILGTEGNVDVRGAKGVRITTGPPPLPPSSSKSTDGVEIVVSELQKVTIQRGLLPVVDQKIEMTPSGITIDAGSGTLTLQSLTQITLSVAEGVSTITLTPSGVTIQALEVTIQGLMVKIN